MARRALPWVVGLAAVLHTIGIARSILPAQDGLKFLRFARAFQSQPFTDVIRASDQHPLYSLSIALVQPIAERALGQGPESWRIAAQAVSMLAALGMLFPLYGFARALFDERVALLSVLLFVLLPGPAEIGHDTLSDALALCFFTVALRWGEVALRDRSLVASVVCGLAAGLGYWTRPEIALLPVAVLLARGIPVVSSFWNERGRSLVESRAAFQPSIRAGWTPLSSLLLIFLTLVGSYAMAKGELSEKLALRHGASLTSAHDAPRPHAHSLPPGLDDPRFDFAPKEESGQPPRLGVIAALRRTFGVWSEGLVYVLVPLTFWGAWRVRAGAGRTLIAVYVVLFTVILVRHAMGLGYLSSRHVLTLVVVAVPFAAAGVAGPRTAHRRASRLGGSASAATDPCWRSGSSWRLGSGFSSSRSTQPAGGTGPPVAGWPGTRGRGTRCSTREAGRRSSRAGTVMITGTWVRPSVILTWRTSWSVTMSFARRAAARRRCACC